MPDKELKMFQLPREMEYMMALAIGTEQTAPPEDLNWDLFFKYLQKNRLETLVSGTVEKMKDPPAELLPLHRRRQELGAKTIRQMQVLAILSGLYHQAEIPLITMKGPLLAADLYGDPSLRYSSDLDLLVREKDFAKAKQILLSHGFHEYIPITKNTELRKKKADFGEEMHEIFFLDDIQVELHWRISFRYPVAFEELWKNRETKKLLGQTVNCLGKEDNLIYLICHAAGHGYSRLRWLVDIYLLFKKENIDYAELYEQMEKRSAGLFLLETLLILYRMPYMNLKDFGSDLLSIGREQDTVRFRYAASVKEQAVRACRMVRLLDQLLVNETVSGGIIQRNYMQMVPVVGRKKNVWTYLRQMFSPQSIEMEHFDLPDNMYFLYYIIRPFYKLWRMTPFYKKSES